MKCWKRYFSRLWFYLIVCSSVMPGVVQAEQASLGPSIAEKARQAVQDVQDKGVENKEAFFYKIRDQLQELDNKLATLKDKGEVLREKTRAELIVQIDEISMKKNDILPKLEIATRNSEATWQDVKQGIDKAVQEIRTAVDQAASKYF